MSKQESFFKFVEPTQLATAAQKPVLRLLDVCYGLGYNTPAALQTIWAVNPSCCVEVIRGVTSGDRSSLIRQLEL